MEMEMEDADDAWASLLPDLLLDIFRRLESTAVIRCGGACKPWRRIIIGNASSLRPCPDRYNPNLLLGFFHHSCPPPLPVILFTAVDTGRCRSLPSFITAGGVGDLSISHAVSTSRDGFLLLRCRLDPDELCLWNPMAGECASLPVAPIEAECSYALLTGYDLSPASSTSGGDLITTMVRVLALAGTDMFRLVEDRLTYQVFTSSNNGTTGGVWGAVQRSEGVNGLTGKLMYGGSTVVSRDAVYWLAGAGNGITCTVGLDVYTRRAWTTELPKQCRSYYYYNRTFALTTSGNGRLSLLHPLRSHDIQVWVLVGDDVDAMEWTLQHKITIDMEVPDYPRDRILDCNYRSVVCPRSGFLFVTLSNCLQLRIDLKSGAHPAVQCMGKRRRSKYYPYEMDWSTYISKMKNF